MSIQLSPNIFLYIPKCCEKECQETKYIQNLQLYIEIIQKTSIGRQLFQDIGVSHHHVWISPHLLTEGGHVKQQGKPLRTVPGDNLLRHIPGKGCSSNIYMKTNIELSVPRIFTRYHYMHCVQKGLLAERCGRISSPCNRYTTVVAMLFHEICHARNNQRGLNQRTKLSVDKNYKNLEEEQVIECENQFIKELFELKYDFQSSASADKESILKILRYGFAGPDQLEQKIILQRALKDEAVYFLTCRVPQLIYEINGNQCKGGFLPGEQTLNRPSYHKSTISDMTEEQTEDLYYLSSEEFKPKLRP